MELENHQEFTSWNEEGSCNYHSLDPRIIGDERYEAEVERLENEAENSLIPASASHLVPKTVTFCRKIELNALPCNFPSENDAVLLLRPKKAIPGAEFNTVWIQIEKEHKCSFG